MSSRRRHVGSRDAPEPGKCIGVFGLSLYTSERELESEFKKFGPLEKVQVVLDGHTGRSRGFAFIYYENQVNVLTLIRYIWHLSTQPPLTTFHENL